MQCIYRLNFTEGFYIGKTTNLKVRLAVHMQKNSCGYKLRDAWETQGYLGHEVIEECSNKDLDAREVYWIELLKPTLNTLPGGEGLSGLNHPRNKTSKEDVEAIVSLALEGKSISEIAKLLSLPYTRVHNIYTKRSHVWATEGVNMPKSSNADELVCYDIDNIMHIAKFGERESLAKKLRVPITSLYNLTNSYNIHGISLKKHRVFLVQTPLCTEKMTEPMLYNILKTETSSRYLIQQVIHKRKLSKGYKILSEE